MTGFKSKPTAIALHGLVQEKMALFSEAAVAKSISLSNQVPTELMVYADENHLQLILRNLISNAIKFTEEGGGVRITALPAYPGYLEILITDSGIGIPAERLATLFDTNAHFTSRGTKGEKGTGLGLLLCKEMAEANEGKIDATSTPGVGSSFRVYLKSCEGVAT
jgi:signal transduction histidine kinase